MFKQQIGVKIHAHNTYHGLLDIAFPCPRYLNLSSFINAWYEPKCVGSALSNSHSPSSSSLLYTFINLYVVERCAGTLPDDLMMECICFGFISCPYCVPADVDMLSLIKVPPKSLAPAPSRSCDILAPSLTHET